MHSPGTPADVTGPRAIAYRVIRRVFEEGAYADRALRSQTAALEPRDRALATMLVFGTVQRRATLDHVIRQLTDRPLSRLDPPVLAALRLGLFQLLCLDRIAPHAAVGESVELVKQERRGGAGLVNAVLRRAVREGDQILAALDDRTPEAAAVRHSVPEWLAEMWWDELGADAARALVTAVNRPAEAALRVNALATTPAQVLERLPVKASPAVGIPEGLVLGEPFDAHGSELFDSGAIMPQSRGSMLVARVVDPQPGDRVLDLCAAPGGKATHLAALMRDEGEVHAVERHPGRARALARTCLRLHASAVKVIEADAARVAFAEPFHRVLLDPPCSGLGTLQSRPDLRWRASPDSVRQLAQLQALLLRAAAAATAPDGVLVYSVCTISRLEGAAVIDEFLREQPEFAAEVVSAPWRDTDERPSVSGLQLRPDVDGTDGFFIARLRRRARGRAGAAR